MSNLPSPIRAQTAPLNGSPHTSARLKLKTSQTSRSGSRQSTRRPLTQQEKVRRARKEADSLLSKDGSNVTKLYLENINSVTIATKDG